MGGGKGQYDESEKSVRKQPTCAITTARLIEGVGSGK